MGWFRAHSAKYACLLRRQLHQQTREVVWEDVPLVAEHSYAVLDTPKTLKRKLDAFTDSAATVKRKLKLSLERERRLRRKVSSFNEIIDDLKHKQLISEDASAMLESQFCSNDELDMATAKRSGTQDLMQGIDLPDESELDVIVEDLPALSPYLGNVVGYIAGFVCRMVKRKIPCAVCYSATIAETCGSALLNIKNRGGLSKPSSSTTYICQLTEKAVRLQEKVHDGGLPKKNAADTVTAKVMAELSGVLSTNKLYPELHGHMFESAVDSNHFRICTRGLPFRALV
ncbi:hypothetical protein HPB51_015339 [Rhipicephalus microplus]|uniref:DNA transposase THAP9 C-terminal domain-containing protein n=1 Tax=Rhipicephalus microplus TaxID=6941 RepID=A0A9J6DVI6_RHIMP|nr:hypothetical protein HPB51_015339 [Rhipicephalus microplus]